MKVFFSSAQLIFTTDADYKTDDDFATPMGAPTGTLMGARQRVPKFLSYP